MQDWRAILGRNVRRLRQQKGLTQEELAFEAEIDLTYMGGIERGSETPACWSWQEFRTRSQCHFPSCWPNDPVALSAIAKSGVFLDSKTINVHLS